MKLKLSIYSQPNYLTRTAIEGEILFAVWLSKKQALTGGKSLARENKCGKPIGIVKSAAQSCLRKKLSLSEITTDRTFENRRGKYKEIGKKLPQAYQAYVEETFLPCDAGDARIFVNV